MTDESTAKTAKKSGQKAKIRRATFEELFEKEPKRDEFAMPFGAGGEQVSFLFVALGAQDYDALLSKHPPTTDQRAKGAVFNTDTFAPALLEKVCSDPEIPASDWKKIWDSKNWGRGEVSALFWRAVELCNSEVDANPIEAD